MHVGAAPPDVEVVLVVVVGFAVVVVALIVVVVCFVVVVTRRLVVVVTRAGLFFVAFLLVFVTCVFTFSTCASTFTTSTAAQRARWPVTSPQALRVRNDVHLGAGAVRAPAGPRDIVTMPSTATISEQQPATRSFREPTNTH